MRMPSYIAMTTKEAVRDQEDLLLNTVLLRQRMTRAQTAMNAIEPGLTAQDIVDGVKLSHQEYLDLVRRATGQHET